MPYIEQRLCYCWHYIVDLQGTSGVTEGGRDTHGLRDGGGAAEDDTGCVAQLDSVGREPVNDAVRTVININ